MRVLAISYATYIWILHISSFSPFWEYLLECCWRNKCYLQLAWRTPYFYCDISRARAHFTCQARIQIFHGVFVSRLLSCFSHGSHFPFHVCINFCTAHSRSHGTHRWSAGKNFAPPTRPGGVEESSVLFDDEVCDPRCYITQLLPAPLVPPSACSVDETLESLRPSVKRSRVVRVLAISYATYIWILHISSFSPFWEYLLECCWKNKGGLRGGLKGGLKGGFKRGFKGGLKGGFKGGLRGA